MRHIKELNFVSAAFIEGEPTEGTINSNLKIIEYYIKLMKPLK